MSDNNLNVTDETFYTEVLQSEVPVLVDFWAPWCGPCRAVAPVIEELARDYHGRAKILKLNVDENSVSARKYGVRSIPTLALFDKGEIKDMVIGAQARSNLEKVINKYL